MYNSKKGVIFLVLVKAIYDGQENILRDLQLTIQKMQNEKSYLKVYEKMCSKTKLIEVVCEPSDYTPELKDEVLSVVSKIIYNFVIDIFVKKEINYFFDNSYFFIKYEEIDEVKSKVIDVLFNDNLCSNSESFFIDKKIKIIDKIKSCIEENNQINIDGFVRFRMKDLFQEIEVIVDRIVEKHMVEKEYNEFIKLLKYFVEVQESKINEVNIIIDKNGSYVILDENNNDVYSMFLDDLVDFNMSMMTTNKDDLLISGLITNSPEKIVIHGVENSLNIEIIETIKQVFEDKVSFCCGCSNCLNLLNKLIK